MKSILVVGASSAIAQALIEKLEGAGAKVFSVSRTMLNRNNHTQLHYSEESISAWCDSMRRDGHELSHIYIFNGILHTESISPEKSITSFRKDAFYEVLQCNTVTPMWWLMNVTKLVPKGSESVVTLLSARIGSISDNRLGGWYSYRASKAALNMLTKTAAIEIRRTHKQCKFLLFHPGTTDSKLSKPFQKNVPEGKLFSPEFVAENLVSLSMDHSILPDCGFYDWNKKPIPF